MKRSRIFDRQSTKMKLTHEIEFKNAAGDWDFFEAEFEAFPRWENDGIGGYEYWGAKGFDAGQNYVSLEYYGDPTWDKTRYTAAQNALIEGMSAEEWKRLCERFCDALKEDSFAL